MKHFLCRILVSAFLAASFFAQADEISSGNVVAAPNSTSATADPWGVAGEAVSTGAGVLSQSTDLIKGLLMDKKTAGALVDRVSAALAKIPGMPSGRVIQAQILKGLGKAAGVIDGIIQTATSISAATDAVKRGDKAAYQKAVADYIITMTSKIVGVAVGDAVFGGLTAATVGVGALPAAAAGVAAGAGAEALTKWLLNRYARKKIEQIIGNYWDWLNGKKDKESGGGNTESGESSGGSDNSGDKDPFDSQPENSPGNTGNSGRYQGLKALKLID